MGSCSTAPAVCQFERGLLPGVLIVASQSPRSCSSTVRGAGSVGNFVEDAVNPVVKLSVKSCVLFHCRARLF